jgi:predicted Zn-dependent protease
LRDDNLVSSQPSQVETFLSTHPAPVDRISNTNQRLQEAGLPQINHSQSGEGIFREEYRTNIRNKIR